MRIRRAELTWAVGGLGMALMAFVVVADRWDAPAAMVWVALPLIIIGAAVVLLLYRVYVLGSVVDEVRRMTVAIANAQIKTDERVAAIGARLIGVSDQQSAMVATLRRTFPAPDDAPTDPGGYGHLAPILGGVESHGRALTGHLEPPSSQPRMRGAPTAADDQPDDDATLVFRAGDFEDSSSDEEDEHHPARAGPGAPCGPAASQGLWQGSPR